MRLVAYDTETHLIQPGLAAPPLVCGSVADETPGSERFLTADEARATFKALLTDPDVLLGGQNLAYDLGIHAAEDPSLVDPIFQSLEEGRMVDSKILEALHDNARGLMGLDPATLQPASVYSLAALETRYLGIDRSADKVDGWRLNYALLHGVPVCEWPDAAVQYPRADARGTLEVLRRQLQAPRREHRLVTVEGHTECAFCGPIEPPLTECPSPEAPLAEVRHNLQCIVQEMRPAWVLRLSQIWGMRTDEEMVPVLCAEIVRKHEESRRLYFLQGLVRVRPCNKKEGEWERADDISPRWLIDMQEEISNQPVQEWHERRLKDLHDCHLALGKGRPIRFAEDRAVIKALVEAAYSGDPPLTSGGASGKQQTSISRDTLSESGNELLEEYGDAGPNEKLYSTYVRVLQQGTRIPICPNYDSIKATQRTSYYEPNLQQLPRKGGVREAFVPRGYYHEETP